MDRRNRLSSFNDASSVKLESRPGFASASHRLVSTYIAVVVSLQDHFQVTPPSAERIAS